MPSLILNVQLQSIKGVVEHLSPVIIQLNDLWGALEVKTDHAKEIHRRGVSKNLRLDDLVRLIEPADGWVQCLRYQIRNYLKESLYCVSVLSRVFALLVLLELHQDPQTDVHSLPLLMLLLCDC